MKPTLLIFALCLCLTGCFKQKPSSQEKEALKAKIGQMFLIGFRETSITPQSSIYKDIQQLHIGGVILFEKDFFIDQGQKYVREPRNIESPQQLAALTQQLKQASAKNSTIPLIIAIDQEGGNVARLNTSKGFPETPSHKKLGKLNNIHTTHNQASKIAKKLKKMGINLNLAPVVDLATNPNNPIIYLKKRSFSSDPHTVAAHAAEFIQAHRSHKIGCVIKHFPGHGSSEADTHQGFTDITNTWQPSELIPYKLLIEQHKVDAIMTGHVYNNTLDTQYPATLSKHCLQTILRNELHFDGVIISDDIQMKAIQNHYSLKDVLKHGILAGIDIFIIANQVYYDENMASQCINIVYNLVINNHIPVSRIEESYKRILQLKQKL